LADTLEQRNFLWHCQGIDSGLMFIKDRYDAITTCEKMCLAGRAATEFYYRTFYKTPQIPIHQPFAITDILKCYGDLEKTYTIRMYAEFEATLRDYWKNGMGKITVPQAKSLIDGIAARTWMRNDTLKNAHAVREYRNALVHGGPMIAVTLGESRKYLCQYLSNLPRAW
jgi:hypothetical protein